MISVMSTTVARKLRSSTTAAVVARFCTAFMTVSAATRVTAFNTPLPLTAHVSPFSHSKFQMSTDNAGSSDSPPVGDPRESIVNVVDGLFRRNTQPSLHCLACDAWGTPAFYVAGSNFKQIGHGNKRVPSVTIVAPNNPSDLGKVFVYHSGIGTGKTVDLAASAYSRNAALTMMVKTSDDIAKPSDDDGEGEHAKRVRAGLKKILAATFKEHSGTMKPVLDHVHSMDDTMEAQKAKDDGDGDASEKQTINFVLAFDDAWDVPNLLQGIAKNHAALGDDMGAFLASYCDEEGEAKPLKHFKLKLLFSVAGRGLVFLSFGSSRANCLHLEPSAAQNPRAMYESLRNNM